MTETKHSELRPKKRSPLRVFFGRQAYTAARLLLWHSGRFTFASRQSERELPFTHHHHHTPLLRKLRNVDMQYQYNKIENLKVALPYLQGLFLQPGETMSYWRRIGKPCYRRGFVDGMVLNAGSYGYGVGGGLCQLSNLIYWLTLHTPPTIVERYRHSYDVFPDANRSQPFGSGATCVYPYRDLMVRNDTNDVFQLCLSMDGENLYGAWRSECPPAFRYEIAEKNHHMNSEYWGGFSRHNEIWRRCYAADGDAYIGEELIAENHALMMYSPFLPDSPLP